SALVLCSRERHDASGSCKITIKQRDDEIEVLRVTTEERVALVVLQIKLVEPQLAIAAASDEWVIRVSGAFLDRRQCTASFDRIPRNPLRKEEHRSEEERRAFLRRTIRIVHLHRRDENILWHQDHVTDVEL